MLPHPQPGAVWATHSRPAVIKHKCDHPVRPTAFLHPTQRACNNPSPIDPALLLIKTRALPAMIRYKRDPNEPAEEKRKSVESQEYLDVQGRMYILHSSDLAILSPPTNIPFIVIESTTSSVLSSPTRISPAFSLPTSIVMAPAFPSSDGDPLSFTTPSSPDTPNTIHPSTPTPYRSPSPVRGESGPLPPEIWAPLSAVLVLTLIAAIIYSSRWKAKRIRAERRYAELEEENRRRARLDLPGQSVANIEKELPKIRERGWDVEGSVGANETRVVTEPPPAYGEVCRERETRQSRSGWWGRPGMI
ncbi:MAG: hypothetical protein LQ352_003714 [Teloschistes flavicans]|nr:MAG: hypothetical protein LQ352_003714 [Teloschistes flavicans]